ncbi:MAG: type IV pilus modification PilV family protein [Solirubrobacterales bacterium]
MLSALRRRLADESGFTLIEGLVAGLVLVVGLLASIGVFESSGHESATGERQQVAVEQAHAELERLRDLPYDDLAVDAAQASLAGWPASGTPGNPAARVVGGPPLGFSATESGAEEMVVSAAANAGVDPHDEVEIQSGDTSMTLGVYRFVSWRNEDCELIDLGGLTGSLTPLLDALSPATGGTFDLVDSLIGPGSLIGNLLGFLLAPALNSELLQAEDLLENLQTVLGDREGELQARIDSLDELELDPCDMNLEAMAALQDLEAIGPAVDPALEQLDQALDVYDDSCLPLLNICTGNQQPVLNAINNLQAVTNPAAIANDLDTLIDALNEIELGDHPYNTKRLTVAVVVEPRQAAGPEKPVWATSVASDPDEGLVTP